MGKTIVLTPFGLASDSYISCALILPVMFMTIFMLQLLVYSELYSGSRACYPILHFFGDPDSCQQTIARIAKNITTFQSLKQSSSSIVFEEETKTGIVNAIATWGKVIDGFSNMYNKYHEGMSSAVNNLKTFQNNYYQEMIVPITST